MAKLRLADLQSKVAAARLPSPLPYREPQRRFPPASGRLTLKKQEAEAAASPPAPAKQQHAPAPPPVPQPPPPPAPVAAAVEIPERVAEAPSHKEAAGSSLAELWSKVELLNSHKAEERPGAVFWGTANFRVPGLGLSLHRVPVHYGQGRPNISMPDRPILDINGCRVLSADGKPKYVKTVAIEDRAARNAFLRAVRAALLEMHPELAGPPPASPAPEPEAAAAQAEPVLAAEPEVAGA